MLCRIVPLGQLLCVKLFVIEVGFNKIINTFSRVPEFNFACFQSLHSEHLEQLAIACPNLQPHPTFNKYTACKHLEKLFHVLCVQ